jgi:hypothetical protein
LVHVASLTYETSTRTSSILSKENQYLSYKFVAIHRPIHRGVLDLVGATAAPAKIRQWKERWSYHLLRLAIFRFRSTISQCFIAVMIWLQIENGKIFTPQCPYLLLFIAQIKLICSILNPVASSSISMLALVKQSS